jgi:hypothetical protein
VKDEVINTAVGFSKGNVMNKVDDVFSDDISSKNIDIQNILFDIQNGILFSKALSKPPVVSNYDQSFNDKSSSPYAFLSSLRAVDLQSRHILASYFARAFYSKMGKLFAHQQNSWGLITSTPPTVPTPKIIEAGVEANKEREQRIRGVLKRQKEARSQRRVLARKHGFEITFRISSKLTSVKARDRVRQQRIPRYLRVPSQGQELTTILQPKTYLPLQPPVMVPPVPFDALKVTNIPSKELLQVKLSFLHVLCCYVVIGF